MIKLDKRNFFQKFWGEMVIITILIFCGFCIKQTYDYGQLPQNMVRYNIVQDHVYAKYNDGKHKSWELKALAQNTKNNNMYWVNVTGADVYRGYKTVYEGKIIPSGSYINMHFVNIGVFLILIGMAAFISILIFSPLIFEFSEEWFKEYVKKYR